MKIILTLLIFIVAFYIAAMVFRRLTQTVQQLADLRSDLAKSDAQLQVKLAATQQERDTPQLEASSTRSDESNTNQTLSSEDAKLKM